MKTHYFYISTEDRITYKNKFPCIDELKNYSPIILTELRSKDCILIKLYDGSRIFCAKKEWIYKDSDCTIKIVDTEPKQQNKVTIKQGYFYISTEDRINYRNKFPCINEIKNYSPIIVTSLQSKDCILIKIYEGGRIFYAKKEWIYKDSDCTIKIVDAEPGDK